VGSQWDLALTLSDVSNEEGTYWFQPVLNLRTMMWDSIALPLDHQVSTNIIPIQCRKFSFFQMTKNFVFRLSTDACEDFGHTFCLARLQLHKYILYHVNKNCMVSVCVCMYECGHTPVHMCVHAYTYNNCI
jgi:hypothetical protein